MNTKTVEYGQVQPGDRLYHEGAYHVTARWLTVRRIEADGETIGLVTDVYTQYGHIREGITIQPGRVTRA